MEISRFHLTRSTIALNIKAVALLFATIALFYQDLAIVANEAIKNELLSYILAIPFLFIYLIYRKRKMLKATIPFETTAPTKKTSQLHEIAGLLAFTLIST